VRQKPAKIVVTAAPRPVAPPSEPPPATRTLEPR